MAVNLRTHGSIVAMNCVGRVGMQLAARAVLTCPEVSIYPWEIWCKDGAVVPGAAGKRLEHWIGRMPILRMVGFVMCTPCHAFGVVLDIQHKVVEVLDCLPGVGRRTWSACCRL